MYYQVKRLGGVTAQVQALLGFYDFAESKAVKLT